MNLNGTKVPLLVPQTPSSTLPLISPPGANLSLNSPRSPLPSASTTYNHDPTLFMCNSGTYNGLGMNLHPNQATGQNLSVATPTNNPYSLYPNNGNSMNNAGGTGKNKSIQFNSSINRFVPSVDTHHNLQNLVALSQMNTGGKTSIETNLLFILYRSFSFVPCLFSSILCFISNGW